jgi:hypothetical protein
MNDLYSHKLTLLCLECIWILFKTVVRTSQETHRLWFTNINLLILFKKVMQMCCVAKRQFFLRGVISCTQQVAQCAEALRHKLEDLGFDSRSRHWNFSST